MDRTAAIESFFGEYGLTELQISTILKLFESYLEDNSIVKGNGIFEVCPKCGKVHPVIVKGGKSGSGKQMYRCTHCGRRFTEDHGTIMHYSHQGDDAWKVLMMDTINGVSLKKTSAKLSLSIGTVFIMRHRFLCSLEKYADNIKVSRNVQLDESQDPINPDILKERHSKMTERHSKNVAFQKRKYVLQPWPMIMAMLLQDHTMQDSLHQRKLLILPPIWQVPAA